MQFFGGEDKVDYLECASFHDVFQAVLSTKTSCGILPIENSTTGRVHQSLHLFFDTAAKVCGETYLKISHNLLMTREGHELLVKGYKCDKQQPQQHPQHGGGDDKKVKRKRRVVLDKIYSHPQVLEQCAKYLQDKHPGVTLVSVSSSSKAAEMVNNMTLSDDGEKEAEGSAQQSEGGEDVVRVC